MPLTLAPPWLASSRQSRSDRIRIGLALSFGDAGVQPMRLGADLAARQIDRWRRGKGWL